MIQRLREILRLSGANVNSLSKTLGMSQSTVNNYFEGRMPSVAFLQAILRAFPAISAEWLLLGVGEPTRGNSGATTADTGSTPHRQNKELVPYYDVAYSLGFSIVSNGDATPSRYISIPQFGNGSADAVVNAYGDSMCPVINNGDMVALKKVTDIKNGILYGEIYAVETEDFSTIKRIDKSGNPNTFVLHPINTNGFADNEISINAIKSIYKVVGVLSVKLY